MATETTTRKPVTVESVIDEIGRVYAERGDTYGRPLGPFAGVVDAANALKISPLQGPLDHALYMILLKISRLKESPRHRDSLMDIVGYVKTYEQCLEDLPSDSTAPRR